MRNPLPSKIQLEVTTIRNLSTDYLQYALVAEDDMFLAIFTSSDDALEYQKTWVSTSTEVIDLATGKSVNKT